MKTLKKLPFQILYLILFTGVILILGCIAYPCFMPGSISRYLTRIIVLSILSLILFTLCYIYRIFLKNDMVKPISIISYIIFGLYFAFILLIFLLIPFTEAYNIYHYIFIGVFIFFACLLTLQIILINKPHKTVSSDTK